MSKAPNPEEISDFLAEQRDEAPAEIQPVFITFDDLWDRKLWHQLTDRVLDFFTADESSPYRLPLYNNFVLSFADKINQLKLVKIALLASQQCKGKGLPILQDRNICTNSLCQMTKKEALSSRHLLSE